MNPRVKYNGTGFEFEIEDDRGEYRYFTLSTEVTIELIRELRRETDAKMEPLQPANKPLLRLLRGTSE